MRAGNCNGLYSNEMGREFDTHGEKEKNVYSILVRIPVGKLQISSSPQGSKYFPEDFHSR
jgi:hypothetical protein